MSRPFESETGDACPERIVPVLPWFVQDGDVTKLSPGSATPFPEGSQARAAGASQSGSVSRHTIRVATSVDDEVIVSGVTVVLAASSTTEKPMETTRDLHRFEFKVPAGKSVTQQVTEEFTNVDHIAINNTNDDTIRLFLNSTVSGDEAKKALKEVLERRAKLADTQRELAAVQVQLKDITEDQGRLRANLDKVPATSAAYKRYLEKFDKQEPVIEKFQEEIKKMNEIIKTLLKELEQSVMSCTF